MKEKENDNYSEKSQELLCEVKGEFDPEIFNEYRDEEIDNRPGSPIDSILDSLG